MLLNGLCSHTYSEIAVNKIQLVERNTILHIDVAKRQIEKDFIDYRENTVQLDSEEGIATLDSRIEFWCNVLRAVAQNSEFLSADLSGGFDSRIAFIFALHSGIDLNKIQIFSIKGTLHTYKEDYEIASQIAEHYDFKLNQPLPANPSLRLSFSDAWNNYFYNLQTFHKAFMFSSQKSTNKCYQLTGYGGETIRAYWQKPPKKFIQNQNWKTRHYSGFLSRELFHSLETLIESAFLAIREKYKIDDENCEDIPQYLYQETRCRHHFGKFSLHNYFKNKILLMTFLLTRYEPDLLTFPFDSNHSIAPETIAYAQKINERFPLMKKDKANVSGEGIFCLKPRDLQAEKILTEGKNNPNIPGELSTTCLKAMFESSRTYGLFTAYFNSELYHYAAKYYDTHVFGRNNYIVGVVGITKVLEDVEISRHNRPLYRDLQHFIEQDFAIIPKDTQIADKFKPYFTAGITLRLITEGSLEILSVSNDRADISTPSWLQKNGKCYLIFSYAGNLEIVAKASANVRLSLGGMRVINPEDKSKNLPHWIDYTNLIVNGKTIFDTITSAWYNKLYFYNMNVTAGEEIKIQVEWLPHRSNE